MDPDQVAAVAAISTSILTLVAGIAATLHRKDNDR